jgi:NADPH:quinone reductase-like Zn-dependent oxidoreductase
MRHIVIPRHGAPEVLEAREAPTPQPGPGDVSITVRAAGVNFADVMARMGVYPDAPPLPFAPGYEVSGRVDAIGAGVTSCAPGDRVVALTRFGGYSTHVVTPAVCVFPIHARLSDVEAAALPVNYLTAVLALYQIANVSEGETVLVHGAGGGVGTAAVQLARLRGAVVIGTSSASKHDAIRQLGASHTIDYRNANVFDEVRRITGGRGADVILDSIGGESFAASYRLLAPLGRLVMCGVSAIAPGERRRIWPIVRAMTRMPRFKPLSLMNRNRGVFGINLAHLWDEHGRLGDLMRRLLDDVDAGRLRMIVSRSFPLEEASAAHRFLQARANIGKIVLTNERT